MSTPDDVPAEAGREQAERVDRPLERLDPRVVTLWRVRDAANGLGLTAAASALAAASVGGGLAAASLAAGVALTALVAGAHPRLLYRSWGYAVRTRDLLLRRGVLWRTTSIVPHGRIQYVDLRRGPLARWLGLAEIVVHTAGSKGAAVTIPGLPAAAAEALRDRLAELGGAGSGI